MNDQGTKRRLLSLVPLQLVILAIGVRFIFGHSGFPQLAGWLIAAGSSLTLIAYAVAIRRER